MTETPSDGPTGDTTSGQASADQPPHSPPKWPVKRFRMSRGRRVGNAVVGKLTRWGLVPHTYVMTTQGRKTGRPYSTPVTLVERTDKRWLVAPYGPVSWVRNARAAGKVTLSRRGEAREYVLEELSAEQAGPILKDYLGIAGATRAYFEASKDSPVAEFIAEADRHPVFALTLLPDRPGLRG